MISNSRAWLECSVGWVPDTVWCWSATSWSSSDHRRQTPESTCPPYTPENANIEKSMMSSKTTVYWYVLCVKRLSHRDEISLEKSANSESFRMHHLNAGEIYSQFRYYVRVVRLFRVSKLFPNKRCLCCIPELKANEMEILETS